MRVVKSWKTAEWRKFIELSLGAKEWKKIRKATAKWGSKKWESFYIRWSNAFLKKHAHWKAAQWLAFWMKWSVELEEISWSWSYVTSSVRKTRTIYTICKSGNKTRKVVLKKNKETVSARMGESLLVEVKRTKKQIKDKEMWELSKVSKGLKVLKKSSKKNVQTFRIEVTNKKNSEVVLNLMKGKKAVSKHHTVLKVHNKTC